MRLASVGLLAAAGLVLGACSFILDFDELQGGEAEQGSGGSAGGGGIGGQAGGGSGGGEQNTDGPGGSAGASALECDSDCDDRDPCTEDSCDTEADPPRCVHSAQIGLVADAVDTTVEGEQFERVTLVAGPNRFYLSSFEIGEAGGETLLYGLGRRDTEIELLYDAANLDEVGQPASALGMVPDSSLGFTLHAYVAFNDDLAVSDGLGRVYYLRFDDFDAPESALLGATYAADAPTRFPNALDLNGQIFGAWITSSGEVALHSVGDAAVETLNQAPALAERATALAMISGPTQPGVMFSRMGGGVFAQIRGAEPTELTECFTGELTYRSMSATSMRLSGAWVGSWTAYSDDGLGVESKAVFCADNGSCLAEPCEAGDETLNFAHNPALASTVRQGDRAGVVYVAAATPAFVANDDESVDAELHLSLLRFDFGENPGETEVGVDVLGDRSLSRMPTDAALTGPDFPAVSFLPPDKLAVSWIRTLGHLADRLAAGPALQLVPARRLRLELNMRHEPWTLVRSLTKPGSSVISARPTSPWP